MLGTLAALAEVGGGDVAAVVERALSIAGVDPGSMDDDARKRKVDSLTDEDRGCLEKEDRAFHDVFEPSMERYRQYARRHHLL